MAKLYFYYSTMNAGKSTALLQAGHNYEERGMRTLLYTAQIDSRDGGRIHSRIGIEREALHFYPELDLKAQIFAEHQRAALACVLVDESQFLTPAQVKQLGAVVDELNIPVLCYGLRTDFRGELFPGSAQLLAWADNLVETQDHLSLRPQGHHGRTCQGRRHRGTGRRADRDRRQRALCAAVPQAFFASSCRRKDSCLRLRYQSGVIGQDSYCTLQEHRRNFCPMAATMLRTRSTRVICGCNCHVMSLTCTP